MKKALPLFALVLTFACSAQSMGDGPWTSTTIHDDVETVETVETVESDENVIQVDAGSTREDDEVVPDTTAIIGEVVVPDENVDVICFSISTEMRERFPSIEDEVRRAAHEWGREYDDSVDCPHTIEIQDDEEFEIRYSAEFVWDDKGRRGTIRFLRSFVDLNRIADTEDSCGSILVSKTMAVSQIPIIVIIMHEFGHYLGVPHSRDGLMSDSIKPNCNVFYPTDEDVALSWL